MRWRARRRRGGRRWHVGRRWRGRRRRCWRRWRGRRQRHDARIVVFSGKAVKVIRLGCHAAVYHVDALVVGGNGGVCREVLGRRNGAPLYTRDAPDAHRRGRVEVERVGIAAAVDVVHAAVVVGIGIWDVVFRVAVGAARRKVDAILEHRGGRVEVDRPKVGAPVDREGAPIVLIRIRHIVGRTGVGATRRDIFTLRECKPGVAEYVSSVIHRVIPVVDRYRVPA